jgi:thioredoxin 1
MQSVNSKTFDQEVIQSAVPVIVDFWATWCGPCRAIKPTLEAMSGEANGQFKVIGVDIDASADLATKYGISAIPAILIFKDGQVTQRFVGVQSKQDLLKAVGQ